MKHPVKGGYRGKDNCPSSAQHGHDSADERQAVDTEVCSIASKQFPSPLVFRQRYELDTTTEHHDDLSAISHSTEVA